MSEEYKKMEGSSMNKFEEHEAMYDEVMKMERNIDRDVKLEGLKRKIELAFDMPTSSTSSMKEWNEENPEVAKLYDRLWSSTIF